MVRSGEVRRQLSVAWPVQSSAGHTCGRGQMLFGACISNTVFIVIIAFVVIVVSIIHWIEGVTIMLVLVTM